MDMVLEKNQLCTDLPSQARKEHRISFLIKRKSE